MSQLSHTDFDNITAFYFIGIGGIGMSALARYCHSKGYVVGGYDRQQGELCHELEEEGIRVVYEEQSDAISEPFTDPKHTIVIYTPAISADMPQLVYFRDNGFVIMKRAELLGIITHRMRALCVAGTHGKTTTSTMLAHLIYLSDINCNAFLGGISCNYGTNLILQEDSSYVVIEADEFDHSFLQLTPFMTVVTSIDPDHLDIYGDPEHYRQGFEDYCARIVKGGVLLLKQGLQINTRLQEGVKTFTYGVVEDDRTDNLPNFYASNIRQKNASIFFDFHTPSDTLYDLKLGVPVFINIENAVAAMAIAWLVGVETSELRLGIASYTGVKRRFNIIVNNDDISYIDDYAHHPKELEASIRSIRQLFPEKKITGIFQPHLYTRTRDFADDFARVLSELDEVILLPIYPAREKPIEGVNSQMLLSKITCPDKQLVDKDQLLDTLRDRHHQVILTLGAGNIDQMVEPIKNMLNSRN